MTNFLWKVVEFAARTLDPDEREAALGDLAEAGESGLASLWAVLDLTFRRQFLLWRTWQPWLAGFGVAVPSCYLLMGVSGSITCTFERLHRPEISPAHWPTGHEGVFLLFCHVLLLLTWSWTTGFVYGSLGKKAVWTAATLCLFPSWLANIHIAPLPRVCLFLFVLPAILGAREGLRSFRVKPLAAFALAMGVTGLMTIAWDRGALWIFNWALVLPVWYLVGTAGEPQVAFASD